MTLTQCLHQSLTRYCVKDKTSNQGDIIMMNNERKLLFIGIVSCILIATCAPALAAEPILGEVTLSPEHPTKLSRITFTLNVIGQGITLVKVVVLECNWTTKICQNNRDNQTMQNIGGTLYRANITLDYPTASYITYWVYVEQAGGPATVLPDAHGVKMNLSVPSTDGNHTGNGNNTNGGKKIPGFEVALFVAAVSSAIILLGRRRYR